MADPLRLIRRPGNSGYVGIDVHRKRSRVAVVTEDGTVELNRNVVTALSRCRGAAGLLAVQPPAGHRLAR
jgi:hypothetical protein